MYYIAIQIDGCDMKTRPLVMAFKRSLKFKLNEKVQMYTVQVSEVSIRISSY